MKGKPCKGGEKLLVTQGNLTTCIIYMYIQTHTMKENEHFTMKSYTNNFFKIQFEQAVQKFLNKALQDSFRKAKAT